MNGWVYILSNPTMPKLLKVGYTERDPISRAKEISDHTGVPMPYEVEYQVYTTHPYQVEKKAHQFLAPFRVNNKREFFKCNYEDAVEAIRKAVTQLNNQLNDFSYSSEISHKILKSELNNKIAEKQRKQYEVIQRRKPQDEKLAREQILFQKQQKERSDSYWNKLTELFTYLSGRERYIYHPSFPSDNTDLREWVLNQQIDEYTISEHLRNFYPRIDISLKNKGIIPTEQEEKNLLVLEKFLAKRIEQKKQELLAQEKLKQEKRQELLAQEKLKQEKIRRIKELEEQLWKIEPVEFDDIQGNMIWIPIIIIIIIIFLSANERPISNENIVMSIFFSLFLRTILSGIIYFYLKYKRHKITTELNKLKNNK